MKKNFKIKVIIFALSALIQCSIAQVHWMNGNYNFMKKFLKPTQVKYDGHFLFKAKENANMDTEVVGVKINSVLDVVSPSNAIVTSNLTFVGKLKHVPAVKKVQKLTLEGNKIVDVLANKEVTPEMEKSGETKLAISPDLLHRLIPTGIVRAGTPWKVEFDLTSSPFFIKDQVQWGPKSFTLNCTMMAPSGGNNNPRVTMFVTIPDGNSRKEIGSGEFTINKTDGLLQEFILKAKNIRQDFQMLNQLMDCVDIHIKRA